MKSDGEIVIVPYNSEWPQKFEKEKTVLEKVIGNYITGGIHHIGSTSIPGLSAKPIIDILIGVESLEASKACLDILPKIQYQYYPYKEDQEHWFCKPSPAHRDYHLHLIPTDNPDFKACLAFRDYLRSHEEARNKYQQLKTNLAEEFKNDRETYTQAKTEFVKEIVSKALS